MYAYLHVFHVLNADAKFHKVSAVSQISSQILTANVNRIVVFLCNIRKKHFHYFFSVHTVDYQLALVCQHAVIYSIQRYKSNNMALYKCIPLHSFCSNKTVAVYEQQQIAECGLLTLYYPVFGCLNALKKLKH